MSGSRWQGSDSGDPLNVHRGRNGADTDQVSTVQYFVLQYSPVQYSTAVQYSIRGHGYYYWSHQTPYLLPIGDMLTKSHLF